MLHVSILPQLLKLKDCFTAASLSSAAAARKIKTLLPFV
jgi:hypothetical protein